MLNRLGSHQGIEDCRDMIQRFDLNGDGVVCFDEFKVMMDA
jgi:calcium-binding protein CML